MQNSSEESFEKSLKQLETIVAELERGDLPLEESLAKYEEGINRLKKCYHTLEEVEKKIVLISQKGDGSFQSNPFQPTRNNQKTTQINSSHKPSII